MKTTLVLSVLCLFIANSLNATRIFCDIDYMVVPNPAISATTFDGSMNMSHDQKGAEKGKFSMTCGKLGCQFPDGQNAQHTRDGGYAIAVRRNTDNEDEFQPKLYLVWSGKQCEPTSNNLLNTGFGSHSQEMYCDI